MASPITAMTARCLLPSDIISSRFIGVGLSGLSRRWRAVNFNGAATARQTDRRAQMSSGSETGRQTGAQWKQDSLWAGSSPPLSVTRKRQFHAGGRGLRTHPKLKLKPSLVTRSVSSFPHPGRK